MSIISKLTQAVVQVMPDRDQDKLKDAHRYIGKPLDRIDGRDKVTGAPKYSAEYPLENLAHAALVFSTIASGTIDSIDTTAAEKSIGVIAVITHKNALKMKEPPLSDPTGGSTDSAGSTVNVLNTDEISWNGQPVAVVVADTLDRAEHAASLVKVTYKPRAGVLSFNQAKAHATAPKNVLGEDTEVKQGDAERALAGAAVTLDHTYVTPRYNHNAIEPHATTAVWNGNKLTVYEATQFVHGSAGTLAKIFSLKTADVRVIAPYLGGGFGGKTFWGNAQICVLAAKMVDRPVRLALSREGVFRIVGGRTPSEQRVALGADTSGKLTSLIHTGVTAISPHNNFPEQFSFPARHLYAAENVLIGQTVAVLNMAANTYMRAPGESIGTFALESAIDELALKLGMDPIALRARNEPVKDPTKGTEFSSRHLTEAYQLGAEKFGWRRRNPQVGSMSEGDWLIGQGCATAYYPAYRLPTAARVRISADGTALVQTSAQEMGMGTATAQTQHAAERFGLAIEKVRFEYGDTTLPAANIAGGSSQTISIALAVQEAFDKAQKELLALAKKSDGSPLAQSNLDDVEARNGGLYRKDARGLGESYAGILARAEKNYVEAEVLTGPPLETMKYAMHSYGAQFCEVRVHKQSGEVRVSRFVGAFDCGRILNPKTARSQFMGGIIMGIGMALTEETFFDEQTGSIMNPSLAEYHIPVNADVPKIETYFLDIPDPHTPLGAHGIGEIGITGVAAAIANAVFHATGKRIRELPITLDKLL
ncbi:MAG TPA: xanthine dehydrogenase family protein molybdopterin-binding subunit [Bryobacteraceae bacterium]|jgi:xanthine dehydrogenase YagR molybdenum-binding subunit|nr:xanthine dehydrogenase family protein molybdopterin-binding subunit [Bryobacteraceae bacterium]